ncbi:hypothetical protein Tco_0594521, partial [Tanacetum coccineum]
MANDAIAPSVGLSRPWPSSGPGLLVLIHADFFPFSAGPYYATWGCWELR